MVTSNGGKRIPVDSLVIAALSDDDDAELAREAIEDGVSECEFIGCDDPDCPERTE